MNRLLAALVFCACSSFSWPVLSLAQELGSGEPLAGTERLTMEGDIAAQMVAGIDKFLLREIDLSVERRAKHWKRDFSSPDAYDKSIEPNRQRLAKILGVVDERVPFDAPKLVATTKESALVGRGENYEIFAVRWPAVRGVHGEGLLLVPKGEKVADIIAIPDADQTEMAKRAPPGQPGRANLTNREYLYRPAFELGRHLIGYEVQKVLAGVDWFAKEAEDKDAKIGVMGYGEGGMLALYTGALDTRVDATCVSGYFGPRERIWEQPLDRNVFGLLEQFGDAELTAMVSPRIAIIQKSVGPAVLLPSEGGAPAQTPVTTHQHVVLEQNRVTQIGDIRGVSFTSDDDFCNAMTRALFLGHFGVPEKYEDSKTPAPSKVNAVADPATRQQRQLAEIDRDTQLLLAESPYVREKFMAKLAATKSVEEYEKVAAEYREIFAKDVIGQFDNPLLEPNPRSRQTYDTEKWTGYEVVFDVFPDVFAYGILCLPKDLKPGEKRPVVVCQHGLEGRPQDTIGEQGSQ
ncbi:MAG: hypothetical protein MUF06_17675, partial [Pirellulaceae bacterium]|nr:hypothetical protein [Pirellulaceae bacterium]